MRPLVLVAAALLSGCLPATLESLRASSAPFEFTVNDNYQAALKKVVPMVRRCYEGSFGSDRTGVNAQIYNELRSAEISVESVSFAGPRRVSAIVEIEAIGDNGAKLKVWQPNKATWFGYAVKGWLLQGDQACQRAPW